MPTHRLDRWARKHHPWWRVGLAVTAALEGIALLLDRETLAWALSFPMSVFLLLVAIYLPRAPLQGRGGMVHPRE